MKYKEKLMGNKIKKTPNDLFWFRSSKNTTSVYYEEHSYQYEISEEFISPIIMISPFQILMCFLVLICVFYIGKAYGKAKARRNEEKKYLMNYSNSKSSDLDYSINSKDNQQLMKYEDNIFKGQRNFLNIKAQSETNTSEKNQLILTQDLQPYSSNSFCNQILEEKINLNLPVKKKEVNFEVFFEKSKNGGITKIERTEMKTSLDKNEEFYKSFKRYF